MSSKCLSMALFVFMGFGLLIPHAAWAQRDAAAKIRGDYRSFWDSSYPHWGSGAATRRSTRVQGAYRGYASVPSQSMVVVSPPQAVVSAPATPTPAQPSTDAIASAPSTEARRFSYDPAPAAVSNPVVASGPAVQAYAAPRTRSTRSVQRHRDAWQYPKTDARHWRPF